jgi:hypothetical protein
VKPSGYVLGRANILAPVPARPGAAPLAEVAPALPVAAGPAPFSFDFTHPDGGRETRAVAYGRDETALYPAAGALRIGLVIGTHASTAYVHMGLETCKRHCPEVEVLVHDDASAEQDRLRELCRRYGASFEVNSARLRHSVGDMSAFLGGLLWSRRRCHDILVKFSRRFVPTRNWTDELTALARESQEATYSNVCRTLKIGFRSEAVAMHPPSWAPAVESLRAAVMAREDAFVEGVVHGMAGRIRPCARAADYRRAFPPGPGSGGYCPWPLLGESRFVKVPGLLWHGSRSPGDYLAVSLEWGLPYSIEDFEV